MTTGISFQVTPKALPADPNRMDIAMFVGFLPLRRGRAAAAARAAVAKELAATGWKARVDEQGGLDQVTQVSGSGLDEIVEIAKEDTVFSINLNGSELVAALAAGPISREALRDALAAALTGITVTLDAPDTRGRAALVLTREGEGTFTVASNPSVGFVSDNTLRDLPVRVRGIADVEALFDTGGRPDRVARVRGLGLDDTVEIAEADAQFAVSINGTLQVADLAPGPIDRMALREALAAAFEGISVTLDAPDVQGRAALMLTRAGDGTVTAYTNPSLGFAAAQQDEVRVTGCPMGVALRSFFTAGGREAVIVSMREPIALFAGETERIAALQALVGGDYGAGVTTFSNLATVPPPALPGSFPARDPWHGLAHLHGLEDVAMVLLPDLAELTAARAPVAASQATQVRPPERFTVCAPEPAVTYDGEARSGVPALADATGFQLWSRLAAWAVGQTARITPEAMVVLAPPLPVQTSGAPHPFVELVRHGNGGQGLAHPQLQIAAPWIICAEAHDLPGRACAPDGLLAGTIAAQTLAEGAWHTVAGTRLPGVSALLGAESTLTVDTAPRLSLIGRDRLGITILSDRTTSGGIYDQAGIRRLIALVLRAARHRGETAVFDANGSILWRDAAMTLTTLLRRLHTLGALRGVREADAFSVLCGPETMRQSDIDAGRVIAEVTLRPAHTIETIEISFIDRGGALAVREAAA